MQHHDIQFWLDSIMHGELWLEFKAVLYLLKKMGLINVTL